MKKKTESKTVPEMPVLLSPNEVKNLKYFCLDCEAGNIPQAAVDTSKGACPFCNSTCVFPELMPLEDILKHIKAMCDSSDTSPKKKLEVITGLVKGSLEKTAVDLLDRMAYDCLDVCKAPELKLEFMKEALEEWCEECRKNKHKIDGVENEKENI